MAVFIKRKGVRLVAVLPEGKDWTVRLMHNRLVAFSPDHPPMILGEDGNLQQIGFSPGQHALGFPDAS